MTKEELLERQQYHWFWGLRTFVIPQQPNLLMTVRAWTPEQAAAIRQKQTDIEEMFIVVRFFYAITNWNHYAEDGYLLKAYDWLASSLPHTTGESTVETSYYDWFTSVPKRVYDWCASLPTQVGSVLSLLMSSEPDVHASFTQVAHMSESFQHDRETSERASAGQGPFTDDINDGSRHDDIPVVIRDGILITKLMLPSVRLLGINASLDARLCLPDLIKAYRRNALLFHPDKNSSPEAGDRFLLISTAFEKLKACFDNPQHGLSMDHAVHSSASWRTFDELERRLDDLERSLSELHESYVNMNERGTKVLAVLEKIHVSNQTVMPAALKTKKELEEIRREFDEMVSHFQQWNSQIEPSPAPQNNPYRIMIMPSASPLSEISHLIKCNQPHVLNFFRSTDPLSETQRAENQPVLMICDRPTSSSH